jgi:guanine deaminase
MQEFRLSAFKGFYLATLGGAHALYLDDKIGSFETGKEADFAVFDVVSTPELQARNKDASIADIKDLGDKLFGLMVMGDDRSVCATYVAGKQVYLKE